MNLEKIEFAFSAGSLTPEGILFSKVALYENGEFLRFANLTPALLQAIQKKGVIRTDLMSIEEMVAKKPELKQLIYELKLEKP